METGHMQIAFHGITKHARSNTKSVLFLLIAICLRASQLLTMLKTFAFAAMLLCLLDVSQSATVNAGQATKPHIVFMMVDDWGWANVGYHLNFSSKEVVTQNIDSLVGEGLQLDQHYAFNWCSPSRSSFVPGKVPIHRGMDETSYNPKDPVSGFDSGTSEQGTHWGQYKCFVLYREVVLFLKVVNVLKLYNI